MAEPMLYLAPPSMGYTAHTYGHMDGAMPSAPPSVPPEHGLVEPRLPHLHRRLPIIVWISRFSTGSSSSASLSQIWSLLFLCQYLHRHLHQNFHGCHRRLVLRDLQTMQSLRHVDQHQMVWTTMTLCNRYLPAQSLNREWK